MSRWLRRGSSHRAKRPIRLREGSGGQRRNGDPVNAAIVSKYSTNAALTGRRLCLQCPGSERAANLRTSPPGRTSAATTWPIGRTHAAPLRPHRPPGLTRKDAAPRRHDPPGPAGVRRNRLCRFGVLARLRRTDAAETEQVFMRSLLEYSSHPAPAGSHKNVFCSLAGKSPPPWRRFPDRRAAASCVPTVRTAGPDIEPPLCAFPPLAGAGRVGRPTGLRGIACRRP